MMEKLSKSKCGYIVKKPYSVQSALNEILPYFNSPDKEEVLSFIKSPKFQREQAENEEFMEDFLRAGKRDGLDEKTLCGMLSTHIVFAHESATQKWRHAKKYHAR